MKYTSNGVVAPTHTSNTSDEDPFLEDNFVPLDEALPHTEEQRKNPPKQESGGPEEKAEREKIRPQIELARTGRSLNDYATELADLLPNNVLYNYGSDVVEIQKPKDSLETPIVSMEPVRFRTWIEKHVRNGVVVNKTIITEVNGELKPVEVSYFYDQTIKETDSKAVLASDSFKGKLPLVERVLDFPMPVVKDGKIAIPHPGYNENTKTYLQPLAPTIDHNMSMDVAKGILLDKILGDFPFWLEDDGQSRTHAIAWLLTPYFRGVMNGLAPFFQFRANRPRSGKDYLAQISHIIYAGEQLEDAALPEYDSKGYEKSEETRKRITTLFHQGRRFVHFANCAGYVEDKYFIQAITAPVWSDRKLGQNALLQFRNEMQFSLSGNMDLSLKPDLEPRSRCVTLAYFDEDENSRTFRTPDLHGWIKDNRRLVLSAIHAVFRTWVDAGMSAGKTPFTSFPKWAKVVGGAMAAAGLGDPCLPHPSSIKRKDPGLAAMSALFEHCHEADVNNGDEQGSWWTLQELYSEIEQFWTGVEAIDEFGWFKDLYSDHDGRLNRRSIGVLIRNWKGRTTGGLKMELDDHDSKSTRHRVRFKPVTK